MDMSFFSSPMFGFVLFWILSGAAYSLPEPDATSGKFYRWFHAFTQFLLANIDKMKAGFPPATTKPKQ